jgi:hypothetical protein
LDADGARRERDLRDVVQSTRTFVRLREEERKRIEHLNDDPWRFVREPEASAASISTAEESNPEIPATTVDQPTASTFSASADYRSIRYNGAAHTLTRNQAAIIKILHEAFQRGTPSVGKSELLAAIESKNVRIQDSFKRSPLWQTLVVSGKRRGTYRLNLSAQG